MLLAKVTPQRVVIDNVVAQRDCWAGGLASVSGPSSTARVCEGTEVLLATGRTGPPIVVAIAWGSELCVIASDTAVAVIVAMIAGVQTLPCSQRGPKVTMVVTRATKKKGMERAGGGQVRRPGTYFSRTNYSDVALQAGTPWKCVLKSDCSYTTTT